MAAPAPAIATSRPGSDPKPPGKPPEPKSATKSEAKSETKPETGSERKTGVTEWIMPIAAVGLIFVMLIPLPTLLLDLLLAMSIAVSVLVLLSAIQILRPSQFSVFPSLILLLTL